MPDSPLGWLKQLAAQLEERQPRLQVFSDYYDGEQKLRFTSAKFRKAFGNRFDGWSDNWCATVVDAKDERLNVEGFRFWTDPDDEPLTADRAAWDIWQANQLDADSQLAHLDALIGEQTYALVWYDENGDGYPDVTIEHPSQMIVQTAAGNRKRRLAAAKIWADESGFLFGTVYLPGGIFKFRSQQTHRHGGFRGVEWVERGDGWAIDNPLGVVPVVPLTNRARLLAPARSELVDVVPKQDAINNLWANLMVAAENQGTRRPWAIMAELPADQRGEPTNPFDRPDVTGIALEGEGRIGTLEEASLDNFIRSIELAVKHIASQTRTPPHYLNASADRLSGESIKAAETGLVSSVQRKQRHFGEAWEEVMRLAFAVAGDEAHARAIRAETIWSDAESRTESEHIDAVGKQRVMLEIPRRKAWELAGHSPTDMDRMEAMLARESLLTVGTDVNALLGANGGPVSGSDRAARSGDAGPGGTGA